MGSGTRYSRVGNNNRPGHKLSTTTRPMNIEDISNEVNNAG